MWLLRALLAFIAICAITATVFVWIAGPSGVDLGTLWHRVSPESLNLVQAVIQRYVHPAVWSQGLLPVLLSPAWLVFSVTAALASLSWLILRRRRKIH